MTTNNIGHGDLSVFGKGVELVPFSFNPNTGASPTIFSGPFLTSVTRTAAGKYTLVFGGAGASGKAWKAVLGAYAVVRDNSTVDIDCAIVDPGVISGTTLTIKITTFTLSTGAAVDITANANSWCRGFMIMKAYPGKDSTGL